MKTKDHWDLIDEEFENLFETYKLKPGVFSHEAHIRLAYIHIMKYGREKAEANMCNQIKGYAESLGGGDKFNKTVTIAAVKAVNHFIEKSTTDNFRVFIAEFPRLLTEFKELLGKHYGYNVFADKKAKEQYREPDLLPF